MFIIFFLIISCRIKCLKEILTIVLYVYKINNKWTMISWSPRSPKPLTILLFQLCLKIKNRINSKWLPGFLINNWCHSSRVLGIIRIFVATGTTVRNWRISSRSSSNSTASFRTTHVTTFAMNSICWIIDFLLEYEIFKFEFSH